MSLPLSFIRIDRHVVWGARPAGVCILLGLLGLIAAGALLEPSQAELQAGVKHLAIRGTSAPPCIPHDEALGNEGGDPYTFYAFNREEELALMRAKACASTLADLPERAPLGASGRPFEILAQNDPSQRSPAAP